MYKTEVINLFTDFDKGIELGARMIRAGELVAFPTETVYGLGADALSTEAVSDVFIAKGRPGDNPLIVHVSDIGMAFGLARITAQAEALMEAFWPGPLTVVLPKRDCVPYEVTAGLKNVALRMPAHDAALALIRAADLPIAAPSANISGKPSPTCAAHVFEDLNERIPLILDGGASDVGVESTVLTLCDDVPTILRPGAVTPEMIESVVGRVEISKSVLEEMQGDELAESPGMKYSHYAPRANVTLVNGENLDKIAIASGALYDELVKANKRCVIFGTEQTRGFYGTKFCVIMGDRQNLNTACHNLFAMLRDADAEGFDEIIIEALPAYAFGLAFMNRALRAATFNVIYG